MSIAWDDRIEALTSEMLACRATGHRWYHHGDTVTARRGTRVLAFTREWRCDRCPTVRHDNIDARRWTVQGRRYTYPTEYRLTGGVVDPAALRRSFYYRTSSLFTRKG